MSIYYKDGQKKGTLIASDFDCTQIYAKMTDFLLDGMACDSAVEVQTENQDEVIWNYVSDIHETYWKRLAQMHLSFIVCAPNGSKLFLFQKQILFEQLGDCTFRISRG